MTKKDYIKIAGVIARHVADRAKCFDSMADSYDIAQSFADILEHDNPRFNRARFLTACGVKPECRECGEGHENHI